jgi:hypothetical protein
MNHPRNMPVTPIVPWVTTPTPTAEPSLLDQPSRWWRTWTTPAPRPWRISSLVPGFISTALVLAGCGLLATAGFKAVAAPSEAAVLLLLAIAHALVGVVFKATFKTVTFDGHNYRIRSLMAVETVDPRDVCLVVEVRGPCWKVVRLHFNRTTRFGPDIAFVAAFTRKDIVASLRSLRDARTHHHAEPEQPPAGGLDSPGGATRTPPPPTRRGSEWTEKAF